MIKIEELIAIKHRTNIGTRETIHYTTASLQFTNNSMIETCAARPQNLLRMVLEDSTSVTVSSGCTQNKHGLSGWYKYKWIK